MDDVSIIVFFCMHAQIFSPIWEATQANSIWIPYYWAGGPSKFRFD
jgi:hypothetical protein